MDAESDVQGKVVVEAGARVIASQIRGPAIIGEDCLVERSYIGPFTALGPRCVIRDLELEYSILFEQTEILDVDVRIERSLLGREVVIRRGQGRPKTQGSSWPRRACSELGSPGDPRMPLYDETASSAAT